MSSTTFVPAGGVSETSAGSTAANEMSVTFSSSTGDESPFAVIAIRNGTPFEAAHASCASPNNPPFSFGETDTVYALWFATVPG